MANKYGWVYKDSVVKWNNARYYFGKDGKRVEWTKRWIRVHGNKKGRYYYIGSLPGRIQEMKGIQNVTMNGKHSFPVKAVDGPSGEVPDWRVR